MFGRFKEKQYCPYDQSKVGKGESDGKYGERGSLGRIFCGLVGSNKFGFYCKCGRKSLEGFELRMNIITLLFEWDLFAHWLQEYVGEKDGSGKTSQICAEVWGTGVDGSCQGGDGGNRRWLASVDIVRGEL